MSDIREIHQVVVNPFSVDDCAEVVGSSFTSTKYTQTVSTIRKTCLEKIMSNPHPDIVQEALSKKNEKKPQLSQLQRAIRWDNSDKKEALQKYKSVNPIELPCDESELPEDTATLSKLVMMLGVRASNYELRCRKLEIGNERREEDLKTRISLLESKLSSTNDKSL